MRRVADPRPDSIYDSMSLIIAEPLRDCCTIFTERAERHRSEKPRRSQHPQCIAVRNKPLVYWADIFQRPTTPISRPFLILLKPCPTNLLHAIPSRPVSSRAW